MKDIGNVMNNGVTVLLGCFGIVLLLVGIAMSGDFIAGIGVGAIVCPLILYLSSRQKMIDWSY